MIVFKTFVHVLNKNKGPVILFTIMLVVFGVLNFNNEDMGTNFVSSKPDVLIVNNDEEKGITKNLVEYIESKANIIDVDLNSEAIDDALFYRNVNYIIYIPEGFRSDTLNHKEPSIEVKSTGDYQASLASMMLNKYLSVLNLYNDYELSEGELIRNVNETLGVEANVEVTSKLDANGLTKLTSYFNFMNYSLLAGLVYAVCLILNSFKNEKIMKRTVVSSMNVKRFNRSLLLSNSLFGFLLWGIYLILAFILLGDVVISEHGLICILNSFVFAMCALAVSFLIGNVVKSKNAVNGIVNVIALGSSFLCGCFVPVEFMPEMVVNMGKVLPSYYYVNTNNLVKTLEEVNIDTLVPIFINMGIIILFTIVILVITSYISKRKMVLN